jgi:hypothetical protein
VVGGCRSGGAANAARVPGRGGARSARRRACVCGDGSRPRGTPATTARSLRGARLLHALRPHAEPRSPGGAGGAPARASGDRHVLVRRALAAQANSQPRFVRGCRACARGIFGGGAMARAADRPGGRCARSAAAAGSGSAGTALRAPPAREAHLVRSPHGACGAEPAAAHPGPRRRPGASGCVAAALDRARVPFDSRQTNARA